ATNELTELLNVLQNNQIPNDIKANLSNQLAQLLGERTGQDNSLVNLLSNLLPKVNVEQLSNQFVQHRETVLPQMQHLLTELPSEPSQFNQFNIAKAKITINQLPLPQAVKQVLLTLLNSDSSQFLNVVRSLAEPATFTGLQSFINNSSVQQQF